MLLCVATASHADADAATRLDCMVASTAVHHYGREGLAVASIARDDPSTLPGDDPFPHTH